MENRIFLCPTERKNSKTYYYIRLISEHPYALLVHNEQYKIELIKEYKKLNRGFKVISIYNYNNQFDIDILQSRYIQGSLKGIIIDSLELLEKYEGERLQYIDNPNCIFHLPLMSHEDILDIILTDMALERYFYD